MDQETSSPSPAPTVSSSCPPDRTRIPKGLSPGSTGGKNRAAMPAPDVVIPLSRLRQPRDTPVDVLGRPLRDLRISVMDRCNFRCPYCMPRETYHEQYRFLGSHERLSFDEIVRLARLFVQLGVRKLRLTGGEPLLRANLPDLVGDLTTIAGV